MPAARLSSTSAADASAASSATCRNACTWPSTAAIRSRWARATSTADTSRAWIFSASSAAVRRVRSAAHCSSPRICGTRKRPSSAAGRTGQRLLLGEARAQLVGAEHVLQGHRVRRRRDVVRGDLADPGDRAQDDVELACEDVELRVGDGEPGQPGEVRDLVPGDPTRICSHDLSSDDCGTSRRDIGRGRRPWPCPSSRRAGALTALSHAVTRTGRSTTGRVRALAPAALALTQSPVGARQGAASGVSARGRVWRVVPAPHRPSGQARQPRGRRDGTGQRGGGHPRGVRGRAGRGPRDRRHRASSCRSGGRRTC